MGKQACFVMMLALVASAAFAQQQQQRDPTGDAMHRQAQSIDRQRQSNAKDANWGEHQAWLNSTANLAKLRVKLAEAWQGMGMSPQGAKVVADAYDPGRAENIHHTSLRGKSDQEVAQMMQAALKDKRYLDADQLLIDYQRQKLNLADNAGIKTAQ